MSIVTDIELTPHAVIGGERIRCNKYEVSNASIHQLCEVLSRLQIGMLESDSNNASGTVVARDSQAVNAAWAQLMKEWERAKRWRNLAPSAIETVYCYLAITKNEILATGNVKVRRVIQAIADLLTKLSFSESARLQYGLADMDVEDFEEAMALTKEVIVDYYGSGKKAADGTADLGMPVASFSNVGVINPPINLWSAKESEASPRQPSEPIADTADTASTVPADGVDPLAGKK